jgi:hypothetical protein
MFNHDLVLAIKNTQFHQVAPIRSEIHNPVEQGVGDTPLLMANL